MHKNILNFLQGLPSGRLELAYENLTFSSEITEATVSTLLSKEEMVLRLSNFPNEDVLMALLETENQQSYSVEEGLVEFYRQQLFISDDIHTNTEDHTEMKIEQDQLAQILQQHNSYAHQMDLLERFAVNTAWLEEPLERIIGVFAQQDIQFLIDTNQTQDSPGSLIEVRASKPVSTSALTRFANMAAKRYPDEFQTEYCKNIYHSNHYEHPVQMVFATVLVPSTESAMKELSAQTLELWSDAIQRMCAVDREIKREGRDILVDLIATTPTLQRSLAHLVHTESIETPHCYPIFERELCSPNSLFSALWLFAYFDISVETVDMWDERTYEALMASTRKLFNPILDCIHQSSIAKS